MAKKDHSKIIERLEALNDRTQADDSCAFDTGDLVTPRADSYLSRKRGVPFIVINAGLTSEQLDFATSSGNVVEGSAPNMRVAFEHEYASGTLDREWAEDADFEHWDADYDYAGEEDKAATGEGSWKSPSHPSQLAKVGDHIKVKGDPDVPDGMHEVTEVDEFDEGLRVSAAGHGWVQSASVIAII